MVATSCAPILSDLQSARHLREDQMEVTPVFSKMSWSNNTEITQNHVGVQAGYGISDRLEARLRYEHISANVGIDSQLETIGVHAFGIGAKYSLVPDKLSLYIPIGFGVGKDISNADTWQIQPTLLYTKRFNSTIELTPSLKYANVFGGQEDSLALNVGLGLSSDLEKWVLRPEYSYAQGTVAGGAFHTFSLGLSLRK